MKKRVTVLMGGFSSERAVSLSSGAAVAAALQEADYDVTLLDVQRNLQALTKMLRESRPDVVFNALHGRYGEDGIVQGILDFLAIPYTHSGLLASAMAMDKPTAKKLFIAAGLPVAEDRIASKEEVMQGHVMPPPYVIKPLNEGSSVGVHIVREGDDLPLRGEEWPFGSQVMVERFIPGRELTVAVLGDRPLAVTEITSARGFYDYDAKYKEGGSLHVIPAPLPEKDYQEALRLALLAHQCLGCRGASRADFRYDDTKEKPSLTLLEVNTQPGMTATSLVPEQAAYAGIPMDKLVSWMVENAACDG